RAAALTHYESMLKKAARTGDRAMAARLQRKIGGLHWDAGDRERAGACFAAGLELLGANDDPIERAHLFQEMGRLAFRAGDNAAAIAWAERALGEPAAARDREEGRRPGSPVAAVRESRGRLLRAHRSLRGRGHRGRADRHRPRP